MKSPAGVKRKAQGPKPASPASRTAPHFTFWDTSRLVPAFRAQILLKSGKYYRPMLNAFDADAARKAMKGLCRRLVDEGKLNPDSACAAIYLGSPARVVAFQPPEPQRARRSPRAAAASAPTTRSAYAAKIKASLALRPLRAESGLSERAWKTAKGELRGKIGTDGSLTATLRLIALAVLDRCSHRSPDSFPSHEQIAQDVGAHPDSVRRLMPALKASGIFLVITVPKVDGGRINYYRPSFADVSESDNLSSSAATESDNLSVRKRQISRGESDNASPSIRTSSRTSSSTSARERATALPAGALARAKSAAPSDNTDEARWARVRELLRTRLGDDVFSSWFARLNFEAIEGTTVRLSAPTRFLVSWVQSHYADDLLSCWRSETATLERVELGARGVVRR